MAKCLDKTKLVRTQKIETELMRTFATSAGKATHHWMIINQPTMKRRQERDYLGLVDVMATTRNVLLTLQQNLSLTLIMNFGIEEICNDD